MTLAVAPSPASVDHLVLTDVSWSLYEHLLSEIANRPLRVTYYQGNLEIMPPLPEHESAKKNISRLIETMSLELEIELKCFGSTTFRRQDGAAGLEPDECYYVQNASRVRSMHRFDPLADPPPDLAIEIDITARSIAREPIYVALGVPELWRYDGFQLSILQLDPDAKTYRESIASLAFPFLPIERFAKFVRQMQEDGSQTGVLREFQAWLRTLPR